MRKIFFTLLGIVLFYAAAIAAPVEFEEDIIPTSAGDLKITFIGHGSLMLTIAETNIHIDPWSKMADYTLLPKGDIILITHEHRDHLDPQALEAIRKENSTIILTEKCRQQLGSGKPMKNGEKVTVRDILIEAVPAYNLLHKRDTGEPFHPKGEGNGYILAIGGKRLYIAGDTENIPEMKELPAIDCAFFADESALYHDSGDGGRCGQGIQPHDSLPLSLWRHGSGATCRCVAGAQGNRGTHPTDAIADTKRSDISK